MNIIGEILYVYEGETKQKNNQKSYQLVTFLYSHFINKPVYIFMVLKFQHPACSP